ncbi:hypothetical protein [Oribacterium sp.]
MGKKKGKKPEGEATFAKKEKSLAKKAAKKEAKKAEKKRHRQEREQALEARIVALEKALQEEQDRKREQNLEEQSIKEDKTPLDASEEYGEQEQEAVEQDNQRDSEEEALEQENLSISEEAEAVVIEEASERREIPVFVEARSSFFSPALPSSGAIKGLLQAPKILQGEIREYLADPEEAMLKEKEKTGHKSTALIFTISLLLMFLIGLYLSNGNPAASLQFSLLYALSFLLLPFFLLLFFAEGRSFSDLFYLFTRGRLALYLLASLSFFSLLLGFPLFSLFLFLLGIPLGIVLDYTALKIEYGQSGKVLKICFLYSIFALSLFLFFGFCFVGFSLLNYILGRLWEGNLNLKGFLEFLLSHFPE